VIDNGVNTLHPALENRIWVGNDAAACLGGATPCYGVDFAADPDVALVGRGTPPQGGQHGTMIAGIIAGAGGNDDPTGIATDAAIMPLTITYGDDAFGLSAAAAAIDFAVGQGA